MSLVTVTRLVYAHDHPVTGKTIYTGGKITHIDGKKATAATMPPHLKTLKIPPAWDDVMVDTDPKAKLWVVGYDEAGRRQPIYSSMHVEQASADKFSNVRKLIENADLIRSQIETDTKRRKSEWNEEATVAYLIFETGIRPGSTADTKALKKAYGATTLRAGHVKIMSSGRVWLDFTGKKGVRIKLRVTNPWLVEQLISRKLAAGSAYTTPIFDTSDARLRRYVKTLADGSFSPKDFRTMRGTQVAMDAIDGRRIPVAIAKRKQLMRTVFAKVAAALGNTPAVCRKSYVDPAVLAVFGL